MNRFLFDPQQNYRTWDEFDNEYEAMTRETIINMSISFYKDCKMDNALAKERAINDYIWFYDLRDSWKPKTLNFLDKGDMIWIFSQVPKDIGAKIISYL